MSFMCSGTSLRNIKSHIDALQTIYLSRILPFSWIKLLQ